MKRLRLLSLAVLLAACDAPADFAPQHSSDSDRLAAWAPSSATTLLHTEASQLGNPMQTVVATLPSWQALWLSAWGGAEAAPPLPSVDFTLSSVVVVGLGTRAGQGHSVAIDSIVIRTGGAILYGTEVQPGLHCNAVGTSSPVHMVHFPGHPPIIDWRVSISARDCPP